MKYQNLKIRHDELEEDILATLKHEVNISGLNSKHVSHCPVIKVSVFDYTELGIIHDELTFMDCYGLQYSIYSECSLEDLIDILSTM